MEMWITAPDGRLPLDQGTMTFRDPRWGNGPAKEQSEVTGEMLEFLSGFEGFSPEPDRLVLDLASRRFNKSQRMPRVEDRAIDLGTTLEILLMHKKGGGGNNQAEITNKMATRAAWALGASFEDRLGIYHRTQSLYKLRSSAVHSGRIKKVDEPDVWLEILQGADLARRLIGKIVGFGHFPNWTELSLGGCWIDLNEPQSTHPERSVRTFGLSPQE